MFFLPITFFKFIFHVKNSTFVNLKSDQDPGPDPHPIHIETYADPQHWLEYSLQRSPDIQYVPVSWEPVLRIRIRVGHLIPVGQAKPKKNTDQPKQNKK
jgi:hypothetical protein